VEGEEQVDKMEIRLWLRKMYTCRWSYGDNVITIVCDDQEFNIVPDKLDTEEKQMLKKILTSLESSL
tara:strand:- start:748 stop:948 length:201 start_codon:yes stop_codon:yes gene_type:complete